MLDIIHALILVATSNPKIRSVLHSLVSCQTDTKRLNLKFGPYAGLALSPFSTRRIYSCERQIHQRDWLTKTFAFS